jgi:chromosome segregation ATPase
MAGNAEVRTVLRIDGQPQGAVEALRQVQAGARDTSLHVTRVTETINQQSERYAERVRARVDALRQELSRLRGLQGAGGQEALIEQEKRVAQARAQVYAKTVEVQQAEERLANERRTLLSLETEIYHTRRLHEQADDLPHANERRRQLGERLLVLNKQLADATVRVASAEQHLASVVKNAGPQRTLDAAAEERLVKAREQLTTVDARLRAAQKELVPLQQQLTTQEQKRAEIQERVAKAEAAGNNRSKARNLTELNKVEAARNQLLTQIEAKEKAIKSVEMERAEALHRYSTAEKELKTAQEQRAVAQTKLVQEETKLKQLRHEVANADQAATRINQQLYAQEEKLAAAQGRSIHLRYRMKSA